MISIILILTFFSELGKGEMVKSFAALVVLIALWWILIKASKSTGYSDPYASQGSNSDDFIDGYLEGQYFKDSGMGNYPDMSKSEDYFNGFEQGYKDK